MEVDFIDQVEIDAEGRLHLVMRNQKYPMIYRSAAGVYWDQNRNSVHSTIPKTMSYPEWFAHICQVLESPGNSQIKLAKNAKWINISQGVKSEIEKLDI